MTDKTVSVLIERDPWVSRVPVFNFLRRVHDDQDGVVSLETVLVIGAIALPILIFLIVKAWPTIRGYFNTGLQTLENGRNGAIGS